MTCPFARLPPPQPRRLAEHNSFSHQVDSEEATIICLYFLGVFVLFSFGFQFSSGTGQGQAEFDSERKSEMEIEERISWNEKPWMIQISIVFLCFSTADCFKWKDSCKNKQVKKPEGNDTSRLPGQVI